MKITILQTDIIWGCPEENICHVEALIDASTKSDLYVLPEMWDTGFTTAPQGIAADEQTSAALRWMRTTAAHRQCAICGSLAVKATNGMYRNRHYFIAPGYETWYDKHHLFSPGGEDKHFVSGAMPVVATWRGVRWLLLTCYDLRFPVFSRYGHAGEYDVIVCVANWPQKRQRVWEVLTHARAVENQCYIVAVNRCGNDPACHYAGGSLVADPTGKTLVLCGEREESATINLDMNKLAEMRQHFKVLDDRDVILSPYPTV